ncbi:hypothetical protein ALC57_09050 [Trachymyrmex cornetzi]|uniref:GIY-YIG domain-containing protein n=1 Tax=Trachymyrmex cornetzi TaxID=471704 RepID=A0A151J6A0_9HYME|nr:hypothetical protein ALC57_09050 [Trachymyrmex cornetzi]
MDNLLKELEALKINVRFTLQHISSSSREKHFQMINVTGMVRTFGISQFLSEKVNLYNFLLWTIREVFSTLIENMEFEQNIELRVYMLSLPHLITNIGCVKWCEAVVRISIEYWEHYTDLRTMAKTFFLMFRLRVGAYYAPLYTVFLKMHFDLTRLAHPDYQEQNIIELVDVLQNNGYPLNVIFSTINNRIEKLAKRKNLYINNKMLDDSNSNNNNYYFLVPYIRNFSEKFFHIAHKMNKKVAFKAHNNLNSIIKLGKDQLKTNEQKGVVYKINCKECDVSYVGQTKRKMGTRIFEHQQDTKNKKHCSSVLAEHQMNNGHNFNWDDIKIMDREQYLFKRLTSEMIFIKKQENGLNRQNDTQKFPEAYVSVLDML